VVLIVSPSEVNFPLSQSSAVPQLGAGNGRSPSRSSEAGADLTVAGNPERYAAVTATGSVAVVGRDVRVRATLTTSW